jgi:predicted enzyme related to lactoylglutathione lyase
VIEMPSPRGKFIWYDVMTTDTKAATDFYKHVVGWTAQEFPMGDRTYTVLSHGATMVAGLMAIPPEAAAMGVKPCWSGYVAVEDVDADAKRVEALGGKIQRPPEDIPNVGRFAVVSDAGGAVFLLFKPNSDETPVKVAPMTPGHIGWHELYAGNIDREWEFYAKLLGWTKQRAVDLGAYGTYQTFAANAEECGGIMTKPPEMPVSFWNYYLTVESVDAAAVRVKEKGGQIVQGPMEVPGGAWIVQGTDPQGAHFALISAKR